MLKVEDTSWLQHCVKNNENGVISLHRIVKRVEKDNSIETMLEFKKRSLLKAISKPEYNS
jgi:hypothetical protein